MLQMGYTLLITYQIEYICYIFLFLDIVCHGMPTGTVFMIAISPVCRIHDKKLQGFELRMQLMRK